MVTEVDSGIPIHLDAERTISCLLALGSTNRTSCSLLNFPEGSVQQVLPDKLIICHDSCGHSRDKPLSRRMHWRVIPFLTDSGCECKHSMESKSSSTHARSHAAPSQIKLKLPSFRHERELTTSSKSPLPKSLRACTMTARQRCRRPVTSRESLLSDFPCRDSIGIGMPLPDGHFRK